jgi:hypothetical protein
LILFQLFPTDVVNTGDKFTPGVIVTGGKFATGIIATIGPVAKCAAGVVDTSGKFATCAVDTAGASWLANISTNFDKIWNDPNVILRGLGEDDSWKKPEAKNLVTLSL